MTSEYTHYNSEYEKRFIEAQTADHLNVRKEVRILPNPIYKQPLEYYDSHVKNSHLYPNISHIKPVDFDYRPPDIGDMITKSIEKNKVFAFGPYVMEHREYNYKS